MTTDDIYNILSATFPAKHDIVVYDYEQELTTLQHFGINTKEKLQALVDRHMDEVLLIDASCAQSDGETVEELSVGRAFGDKNTAVTEYNIANGFWFPLPDLLSVAMDLEFDMDYLEYMSKNYYDKDIYIDYTELKIVL